MVRTLTMQEPKLTKTLELTRWLAFAQRKAAEDWSRERDISFEQAFALAHLVKNPGDMQRDIAKMSRTSAASVSSLLKGLQRRGLVERRAEPGDDRIKRVYATPAGLQLIAGLEAAMTAADEKILAPLNKTERKTLHALLVKLTSHLPHPTRS